MEYVSQITLEVNGRQIDDFNSVTEGERELKKEVKLMNKSGIISVPARYPLKVEYVVPKDAPEFDFESVADGTLTIDYGNGTRLQFTGVYTLKIGETKFGDEKEATRAIDLIAMNRTKS